MIYFLRHGESEANLQHVFAGQKDDSPLTTKGREQAATAANQLSKLGITRVITTSLSRAKSTAEIIAKQLNLGEITIDDRFLEYDMGDFTGKPNRTISSRELVTASGAENPILFHDRVINALIDTNKDDGNTLIVSHAGVARIIEAEQQGIAPHDFYDIPAWPNATVHEIDKEWLQSLK